MSTTLPKAFMSDNGPPPLPPGAEAGSERPVLSVPPTRFQAFCVGIGCATSEDKMLFVLQGTMADGGQATLLFPFDDLDSVIETMREAQARARSGLVVPPIGVPKDVQAA